MNTILKKIPGGILSFLMALCGVSIAKQFPQLGAPTYTILLGILCGNFLFIQDIWKPGTAFFEKKLLEISVLLLGLSLTVQSFVQVGVSGLIIVVMLLVSTLGFAIWFGNRLKLETSFSELMGVGNAICGSSAIVAVSDVIDAKQESKANAILWVNLMGTILMLGLPVVAQYAFGSDAIKSSLLIGGTIQSVGQVAGAASQMGSEILELAMLVKIIRVLLLVFVVLYFATKKKQATSNGKIKAIDVVSYVPWYVFGFVGFFILRSLIAIPSTSLSTIKSIGSWLELSALGAIGLRINLKSILSGSKQIFVYTSGILLFQIIVGFVVITLIG